MLYSGEPNRERVIDLNGPEGNANVILGMAKDFTKQLQEVNPEKYNWEIIKDEMTSGDYENLVKTFDYYFGDFVDIYNADDIM